MERVTPPTTFEATPDLWELASHACTSTLTPDERERLELLLDTDGNARRFYGYYMLMHGELLWRSRNSIGGLAAAGAQSVTMNPAENSVQEPGAGPRVICNQQPAGGEDRTIQQYPTPFFNTPIVGFISTTFHGSVGYLSSGWPVAYLIATVIFGIGALIGAFTYVSQPNEIAQESHSAANDAKISVSVMHRVGYITGMVDCKWVDPSKLLVSSSVAMGQIFSLSSGLMEITYDTGAKVILQGPAAYEVEAKNGGFLSVGRMTGKVEAGNAKGFSVRTPTVTVTDLGTEFGVEVDEEGQTTAHVFRGAVKFQPLGGNLGDADKAVVLHENESIQTCKSLDNKAGIIELRRVHFDPGVFARHIPRPRNSLDLSRVVIGDSGWAYGLDPSNGVGDAVLVPTTTSDDSLHPYTFKSGLIDRVFAPNGKQGAVQLDSAGHRYDGFSKAAGSARGSIRAARTGFSSDDVSSSRHGLLGFQSNVGITFDLKVMRERYPGMKSSRFRSTVFRGSSAERPTILFQDDFQSDQAGTMPRDAGLTLQPSIGPGNVGGRWRCSSPNPAAVQLWNNPNAGNPTFDAGTNHYVKLERDLAAGYDGSIEASGWKAETTNQIIELRCSIWKPSTSTTFACVGGYYRDTYTFSAYLFPGGVVKYFDGSGKFVDTGLTFQEDAWQDVTIRADMATQTFSLTVAGSTVDNLQWQTPRANYLERLFFGNGNGNAGSFFVDNVKLSLIPGLADSYRLGFGREGQSDLRVFVDGRLAFSRQKLRPDDGAVPIEVQIGPNDRFLTLVSTNVDNVCPHGWIVFDNPVLDMASTAEDKP